MCCLAFPLGTPLFFACHLRPHVSVPMPTIPSAIFSREFPSTPREASPSIHRVFNHFSLDSQPSRVRTPLFEAEHQRIDSFELWCWKRFLRVLWTARRSNRSMLKELNPEYSLEELMVKLKLQYFGHVIQRADSMANTLMLGKTEGRRRRGRQRMRWLDGIIKSMDMSLSKLQE